jgi:hypothetical protein
MLKPKDLGRNGELTCGDHHSGGDFIGGESRMKFLENWSADFLPLMEGFALD